MQEATPQTSALTDDDDARLASLGYSPQLNRVLGLFSNFSVAFTYLSPVVGIYSLFAYRPRLRRARLHVDDADPGRRHAAGRAVFGELASHYPIAGAIYQYSKYNVGRRYGWFVGWFYGIALLVTVASVDTGVVGYFCALVNNWFGWSINPASHLTILIITLVLLAIQTALNITGAKVMAPGRPGRRLRRDPRHHRRRDRAGHPRVPPRLQLPVQHPGRGEREDQRARA